MSCPFKVLVDSLPSEDSTPALQSATIELLESQSEVAEAQLQKWERFDMIIFNCKALKKCLGILILKLRFFFWIKSFC